MTKAFNNIEDCKSCWSPGGCNSGVRALAVLRGPGYNPQCLPAFHFPLFQLRPLTMHIILSTQGDENGSEPKDSGEPGIV